MNEVRSYPYKCTYCERTGKYKARELGIAMDFRCPHDGATLIFQEPMAHLVIDAIEGVQVTDLPAIAEEIAEFTHHLSDEIIRKLGVNL